MTKAIPKVQKYMTTSPITVESGTTLAEAQAVFQEHNIRHLPVMESNRLAGVLSSRDVALAETLAGADPEALLVRDAMSLEVYAVSPDTLLDEVASEMVSKKYGSAVVMQNQKVVGIFTTVDMARAMVDLLETRLAH
jgi:acetoin utilization protein AcuB